MPANSAGMAPGNIFLVLVIQWVFGIGHSMGIGYLGIGHFLLLLLLITFLKNQIFHVLHALHGDNSPCEKLFRGVPLFS